MPTPAARKRPKPIISLRVFFARAAKHILWARSCRTHSAFTTWPVTFGNGLRIVTTTAIHRLQQMGARTELHQAMSMRTTAKAIACGLIAAAHGCFRRGCYDRLPENAIPPITAITSWDSVWQRRCLKEQLEKPNGIG